MRPIHHQSDPNKNRQFHRQWESGVEPSGAEIRLSELRAQFGNIEGDRLFADLGLARIHGGLV